MSVKIGSSIIRRGEKLRGHLKVAEASTHDVTLPYIVVNGTQAGPRLCVLGGVHPLEYAGTQGVLKVANEVDPKTMKGTLFLLPVVNTDGFHAKAAFNNPIDYVNQNRVYPGDPKGTMSRRVAHLVFNEFVSKSGYLIDSHGGDLTEDISKYVIIANTKDEKLRKTMIDMASCYDSFFIQTTNIVGSSKEAMTKYGIPCITPETGTPYPVKVDDVNWHYNGIMNVMKLLGMMEGTPKLKKQSLDPEVQKVVAEHGGLWIQRIDAGSHVKKGDILGEVISLVGETLETLEAPCPGVISTSRTYVTVNQGDVLAQIAQV
jgi:predicted deacylase